MATLVGDVRLEDPVAVGPSPGHDSARLLVWSGDTPLGEIRLPLPVTGLTGADLVAAVRAQLGARPSVSSPGGAPVTRTLISVVVASHERTASLLRCLDSLQRLRHQPSEVIVVDSAPASDRTAQALADRVGGVPLRYLRTDRPGVAHAHNLALARVRTDIVAFTDDDVIVHPNWTAALGGAFTDDDIVCATGLILPAELDTPAQQLIEDLGGYARGFERRRLSTAAPPPDPLFPFTVGRLGSGANMAFRTDWLRGRGGFDAAIGTGTPARGGDDLAAFADVLLDGRVLVYEPGAVVRHVHRRELGELRKIIHSYGYGLSAYLLSTIACRPQALPMMLRRGAGAVRYLAAPASPRNRGKGPGLTLLELAGVLAGPWGYLRSRWRYRDG
ncbi:hypothetical protein FB565_003134 [Actinoplanes lutulentus]|uniref:Glycosyl transferase family 2 n=1 Tax=Actinoplanes lutulentus TaxID=1287878 RepID=A0A327YXL2_9ACTN|nr:glycosyltransferase [Actinoplanes lutulentus]MBB2943421.1 hypothetical protein [Actinoplanes lutulentus]RAK26060.1 glycosyl transferase family 2 [Actinoplanes lutulentus]